MTIVSMMINGVALYFILLLVDEMEDHIKDENDEQNNYF